MLVSFTIDYLFETLLDVGQKETAIDNLLRCLVCDIQSQRAKQKRIMALIALETLKSSTGDDNLGLRIQINFDEIMQRLSEYITTINNIEFFEFVADFI